MHGPQSGIPVPLGTLGGLVTVASPDSLPEGASPRCYDNDYIIGQTKTRAGTRNAFTYAPGTTIGPVTGGTAVSEQPAALSWANPSNVLLNTGVYATCSILGEIRHVGVGSVTIISGGVYDVGDTITATFSGTGSSAAATVQTTTVTEGSLTWKYVSAINVTNRGNYSGPITVTLTSSIQGTATAVVVTEDVGPLSDALDVTNFGFDVPSTDRAQGFLVTAIGYASASCTLNVQMLKNGVPVGDAESKPLNIGSPTTLTFGAITDLFNATWAYSDLNSTDFGFRITVSSSTAADAFVGYVTLSPYLLPAACNFQWIADFTAQNGDEKKLMLDADGNMWVENLTTDPGILHLLRSNIDANSHAVSVQGPDVEYIAFNDGTAGNDVPLQYTPKWIDKITQVGPGKAPIFTAQQISTDTFAISTIDQPPAATDGYGNPFYGYIYFLQSSGPGSTTPGNVVTIYYSDSTAGVVNSDLVNAFNAGLPVYLYLSVTGTPVTFGPYTQQVTSVGEAQPPGQPRQFFYFTYIVPSVAFTYYQGSGHPTYQVAFQRTLSTMQTAVPVPGLVVNNQVAITGASVLAYDATWTITQTLNSATMVITQTSVTSGVATYNYSLSGGSTSAPAAGELITITGTTNANGALNLVNATIDTATGGSTGSFTIAVTAPDASAVPESGSGVTAGTLFTFDPGAAVVGTATSPIYGPSTGGSLTFGGASGQFIGVGTRQGTVFFITRNGFWTAPAPPVTFTCPSNTGAIIANQIPIGPPNVIARGISFTEPGQNGTPGANFFTIPQPVNYIVQNVTYTSQALIINDNVTTTASFFFTDSVLLQQSEAIDVQGFNLFNLIEIGNPGWILQYDSRNFYGLCLNKVQNFNNLSFDGGYLPAGVLTPLGWTQPDAFGSLVVSPKFGDSYRIANYGLALAIVATEMTSGTATYSYLDAAGDPAPGDPVTVTGTTNGGGVFNVTGATIATVNTTANTFTVTGLTGTYASQPETGTATITGTFPTAGLISQSAYQDAYQQAIIQPNTEYSVRMTARIPSGLTTGNLVVSLSADSTTYGTYTIPFSDLQTNMETYTGTLLVNGFTTVPSNLLLNVYATDLGPGADVEIDRLDVFPTAIPVLETTVYGSYANDFESVDAVSGQVQFISENRQRVNGAMVLYDTFYGLKDSSMYSLRSQPNLEPAQWDQPEVAQRAGACGTLAFDFGEQWFVTACRNGIYLYEGGQPGKIMQEIYQIWDAINWTAKSSIWMRNDVTGRRLFIGIPLPTPNFWLPDAPVNANPTTPNVILMLNYQGLDTGGEIKMGAGVHTTMFGTLNAVDERRKWSLWQIPSPFAAFCKTTTDQALFICNGKGNSKVYTLDETATTDDGTPIDSLYTTAGLGNPTKENVQALGAGRKRIGYMSMIASGSGNMAVRFLPNELLGPGDSTVGYNAWSVPGGFDLTPVCLNDREASVNFVATRTFVEFRGPDWTLSEFTAYMKRDTWNPVLGRK
jgi:hypothetical protein